MATKIQPDAPHPDSYRPDLPLRSELVTTSAMQRRYEQGYDDAVEHARRKARVTEADFRAKLAAAEDRIATLEATLSLLTPHPAPRAAEG